MAVKALVIRRLLILVVAAAMGLTAVAMMNKHIRTKEAEIEAQRQQLLAMQQEIIVVAAAAQDLPEGAPITREALRKLEIPKQYAQPYAVMDPRDVIGKVTMVPIATGEQILMNKLRNAEDVPMGSSLSGVTPDGRRAVTIVVDTISGVGGFVRPRDKVDVLWMVSLPGEDGRPQPLNLTLFQEVPVLAVGPEYVIQTGGDQGQPPVQQGQYTVTLALPPQETSLLLFARDTGKIQLSLRNRNETGAVAVAPSNIGSLMEKVLGMSPQSQAPDQERVAKVTREVEVYKGLKRDVVSLSEDAETP